MHPKYDTYCSTTPQADGANGDQRIGCCQPRAAECQGESCERLEAIHNQNDGIEVHYPSGIEVDQSWMLSWVELDPRAPLQVRPVSNEPKLAHPETEAVEFRTPDPPRKGRLCGLPRRYFWIVVVLLVVVAIGAAVGGAVGATTAHHNKKTQDDDDDGDDDNPANTTSSSTILRNSSIAADYWRDSAGNKEYRVYIQEKEGSIVEVAWASNYTTWNSSRISGEDDDIMVGTCLTSAVGYPHANATLPLLKNVYFLGRTGTLYERQSPYTRGYGIWGDDHVNGLSTALKDSSILSLWYERFNPREQILAVVFQNAIDYSISIAKYTSNDTSEGPWSVINTTFEIEVGSALAATPIKTRTNVRLYTSATNVDFPAHTALSISTQDNRNYFTSTTLPECVAIDDQQLTHLILFPTLDQKGLNFISWNCSSGFLNQTDKIEPLLHDNRTYLGLASTVTSFDTEDQRVYVLFDAGDGPEIEEWEVPLGAQGANWEVLGKVPVVMP
ncbi:hypothetical protein F4678DRAFT_483931 [Xylaria arbuscula]|nr:hypothetical protein F4678DRAFT_483931 [Xylaria arbuscula]